MTNEYVTPDVPETSCSQNSRGRPLIDRWYFAFLVLLAFTTCAGCAGEGVADLAESDPYRIVRLHTPYPDLFIRQEFLPKLYPPGDEELELRCMNIFSIPYKVSLWTAVAPTMGNEGATIDSWEWRDVTSDGKPEFVVWRGESSHRHFRKVLYVYQVVRTRPFPPEQMADCEIRKIFEGYASWRTWQTYPDTTNISGAFSFERTAEGVPTIVWRGQESANAEMTTREWQWDGRNRVFRESK